MEYEVTQNMHLVRAQWKSDKIKQKKKKKKQKQTHTKAI